MAMSFSRTRKLLIGLICVFMAVLIILCVAAAILTVHLETPTSPSIGGISRPSTSGSTTLPGTSSSSTAGSASSSVPGSSTAPSVPSATGSSAAPTVPTASTGPIKPTIPPVTVPSVPTQPTTKPTEPSVPATTKPTAPTAPTTKPTLPTQPTTQPTQPTTQPTQPTTQPTQPTTQPTQPTTQPTQPTTQPTQPTTQPTQPTTQPTQPTQPTKPPFDEATFFAESVFIGDSVTQNLGNYCLRNKNALHGAKIFGVPLYSVHDAIANVNNSGVISLSYQGQKMRPEDMLAAINPKRVFFCLGLNEVGYDGGVNWTIGNWGKLIKNIRAKCPNIEIYIQSCTPIWIGGEKWGLSVQRIDQYNVKLEQFCKDNGCYFVNIAEVLKDEKGGLKTEYCSDKYIHLTNAGVEAWIKYLKAYAAAQYNKQ